MIVRGEEASYSRVRTILLREHFDIIHVAAHARYEDTTSEESGIVLNDGILRARELYNVMETEPPWLVFMNACESARSRDLTYFEKYGELSGLAFAFVNAGASAYLGTSCLVNDVSAATIAVNFYKYLLGGLSVGDSLRRSKLNFNTTYPGDLSWLAFVLHGDPNSRLVFEAGRDISSEVRTYISKKKGEFSISGCAKDLGVPISEIKKVLVSFQQE